MTLSKNPPATGTAPMTPTADGSQPTARLAAPTESHAIGALFRAPVRAAPIPSGAPVTLDPVHMASPAAACSTRTQTVVTAISVHTKRIRETGVANSGVQRRARSSATIPASRVAAYRPVGTDSRLNSAAAKPVAE